MKVHIVQLGISLNYLVLASSKRIILMYVIHHLSDTVMNGSPDNPEKTQQGPGGRVEYWDHRQKAGAIEAPESNVRKDSPDEPKWTHQEIKAHSPEPVEAMVRGESDRVIRTLK